MLKDRLRTAAILIAIVAAMIYLDANHSKPGAEGLWLLPLLLFFAVGTAHDMVDLLAKSDRLISKPITLASAILITFSACIPMLLELVDPPYPNNCPIGRLGWVVLSSLTGIFLILAREMRYYGVGPSGAVERTSHGVFVSLYVGLPMALLVGLRDLGSGNWGLAAILTTIAVTKSTDAGAYFVGKTLGRHKLIPRLSPGKTWEGAVGGMVTATLVAFACLKWLFPAVSGDSSSPMPSPAIAALSSPIWGGVLLGIVLALSGMIGDLAESLVKRECGAKDSGNLLPGMGGVWDVTDSLIAAVLPAFLCFSAGVAG